jgi:hypothetical protein
MPQVELIRPIEVGPTGGSELTITNEGSRNTFYGTSATVSPTNKTGTLTVGESLTLTKGTVWLVAENTPVILNLREQVGASVPSGNAILGNDGAVGGPGGSPLESSIVVSRVEEAGEVEGAITPSLAEDRDCTYMATQKGNVTVEKPSRWPIGEAEITLVLTQNGAGGHAITIGAGILPSNGQAPVFTTAANEANIFTLWSPNSGANVYLFVGPEGQKGTTGATGATGEVGPASPESMARASVPWAARLAPSTASFVPTQWKMIYQLVQCPVKSKKLRVYMGAKSVGSGREVRATLYDVGQTTAGTYTLLGAGSLYEPKTEYAWEAIATFEKGSGEFEPGNWYLVGVGANTASIELIKCASFTNAEQGLVPVALLNGLTTMATTVRLTGAHTLTETTFKEATPPNISEATMNGTLYKGELALQLNCRWI